MYNLSFSQKLKICFKYPLFYLIIVLIVNLGVHYHSNHTAEKVNSGLTSNDTHLIPSEYTYTFSRWGRITKSMLNGRSSFGYWMRENGKQFRSVFMFNEHTDYYLKHYNNVTNISRIEVFDFLHKLEDSTFKSAFSSIFLLIIPRNFLTSSLTYNFIFFILTLSAMMRHWQYLSCLEKKNNI